MFGSDYPFLPTVPAVKNMNRVKLPPATQQAIDRNNALKLFPRLRKLR
jgi:predicted TIM-barrel fold metal-dependent hydrolase